MLPKTKPWAPELFEYRPNPEGYTDAEIEAMLISVNYKPSSLKPTKGKEAA